MIVIIYSFSQAKEIGDCHLQLTETSQFTGQPTSNDNRNIEIVGRFNLIEQAINKFAAPTCGKFRPNPYSDPAYNKTVNSP